jgi:hypothetical protein
MIYQVTTLVLMLMVFLNKGDDDNEQQPPPPLVAVYSPFPLLVVVYRLMMTSVDVAF